MVPVDSRIKPRRLRQGDRVGIISPASPPEDPVAVARGLEQLRRWGLQPYLAPHALRREGYLAGNDEQRLADIHAMFLDPEVKAIWCLRGGYGSLRLLPGLDLGVIRQNPKLFIGYSDITALHLVLVQGAGLVTLHGPMVATELSAGLDRFSARSLLRHLFSGQPAGLLANPPGGPRVVTINPGVATGELLGGNLSLVASTAGTPYQPRTRGSLLFLEEVGEEPYRVDRLLTQLLLAGMLDGVAGILFGDTAGPQSAGSGNLVEVLRDRLGNLPFPCCYGLALGHGLPQATLPLGVQAVLDADRGTLNLVEPATVP